MKPSQSTILVVDDDDTNRDMIALILRVAGYNIEFAEDGRRALEKLKSMKIDLVLLDLMMPVIDGYQVLRVVRADEALNDIPIIVVTAVGKKESVKHCINMGALDYLIKPFEPEVIRTRITSALAGKQLEHVENALSGQLEEERRRLKNLTENVLPLGLSLTHKSTPNELFESTVEEAMACCQADAGILYLRTKDDTLQYEIVRNQPLGIALGGEGFPPCTYPPIHLLHDREANELNDDLAVTQAVHTSQQVRFNVDESPDEGDLFMTRMFNEADTSYRSISFLITPLKAPSGKVLGVLELINSRANEKGLVVSFDETQAIMMDVFCQLAAVGIEMQRVRNELDRAKRRR